VTSSGEQMLKAGMCAGYPAGKRDAHLLKLRAPRIVGAARQFVARRAFL